MYQAGLVLEGGGMKGVYTAGVLDFFLDKSLEFSNCYGVSAGAITLCSYLSKQRRRGYRSLTEYIDNKRFNGPLSLLTNGNIFHSEFCYGLVPNYMLPFDYETYNKYEGNAYAVATDIQTGEPAYLPLKEMKHDITAVQASASLPLVSKNVEYEGRLYLDGGIADSIPIRKAIADGNQKNVVVLTKEVGYYKQPSEGMELLRLRYRKYPKVYELMKNRHKEYNETMEYLKKRVQNGQAFIIQPKMKNEIGRMEKDEKKLKALYEVGYEDAKGCYEELLTYLEM